jgi:hypothetical protein
MHLGHVGDPPPQAAQVSRSAVARASPTQPPAAPVRESCCLPCRAYSVPAPPVLRGRSRAENALRLQRRGGAYRFAFPGRTHYFP